jgi:hypothetical protein
VIGRREPVAYRGRDGLPEIGRRAIRPRAFVAPIASTDRAGVDRSCDTCPIIACDGSMCLLGEHGLDGPEQLGDRQGTP